ncbi:biotin transporter BioY [Alkalihalobacillus sp. 1P02AB]|uniref:biotin transporter BioY n=1 Tax=Alkalihalobacillus sp. 1P02AB TaxID=3132260 RepID=UPI0039A485FA
MTKASSFKTIDLVLIPMFAALMAIGANLTAMIVIGGVPITLQTFFAILAGALLGSKRGTYAILVYLIVGLVGFPVFAQFHGGLAILLRPTFGFLLSFLLVAYCTGKWIEKSKNKTLSTFIIACFIGLIITYVIGTNYMYFAYQFIADIDAISYSVAWLWMLAPAIKDIILTFFAALIAQRIYHSVKLGQKPLKNKMTA